LLQLINEYAIDVVGSNLRVATTINQEWGMWIDPIMTTFEATTSDVPAAATTSSAATTTAVADSTSRTENYVIILNMPGLNGTEQGVMEEIGRVQIGKPNETITAVRFFDNVAYAVTFERKDPFYVLDLSNPSAPYISGELEISGFSEYLQPMNDQNSMLLAIGQETDDSGTVLGVQLTVFDVTTPANPVAAQRYVIERNPNSSSWTDMSYDFKSGRYNRQIQRLIIPMEIYDSKQTVWPNGTITTSGGDSFNGFMTFVVNATTIERSCDVEHGNEYSSTLRPCYYCSWFPSRSMIFDGQLMTVKNHFVKSTNMNTCVENWSLEVVIAVNDTEGGCCGIFY